MTAVSAIEAKAAAGPSLPAEVRQRAEPIITWLLNTERLKPSRTPVLLDRYARCLVKAGLPIARVSLNIRQLHPQLVARSLIWDSESGRAVELDHEHGAQNLRDYLASPVKPIFEGEPAIRRRLEEPSCPLDYAILRDLKDRGLTDYFIRPLLFSGGLANVVSIGTRRPGGFADLDIALLDATAPAFAAVLELQLQRRTARDLLGIYVGHNTGERVFNGAIRRGEGEILHAVIWYCDLRGYSRLSESLPLPEVIALLNDFFDAMAKPVTRHGGEILKFIGDAMLAIFPCADEAPEMCQSCDAAISAAEEALAGVAALNETRRAEGKDPIACGVAIHGGDVMYGNIGAADRLDFTVIGPAVNVVTRLEQLCAELDRPIVVSKSVAQASRRRFHSLGGHALRGINLPQDVFTPV